MGLHRLTSERLPWPPETLAEAARQITVPVEFVLQWDDEHIPRSSGLALFDAFASKDKTLHANAGGHKELPRFEADTAAPGRGSIPHRHPTAPSR